MLWRFLREQGELSCDLFRGIEDFLGEMGEEKTQQIFGKLRCARLHRKDE